MEKCRICLRSRKRMHSLYESMEKDLIITYADMVASFSNVKLSINDGLGNEICVGCCKRLKEIYEFKCQIERSDIELHKSCQLKRIMFTDIQDIKSKIDIKVQDNEDAIDEYDRITENFVKSGEKMLNYNNTIIKRIQCQNSTDKKKMSVKEFLESIKQDPDNEYDIIYDVAVDYDPEFDVDDGSESDVDDGSESDVDDYKPEVNLKSHLDSDEDYTPAKNKRKKYKKKELTKKGVSGNKMSIKPVYLLDLRLARTKMPFKKRKSSKTKHERLHRRDMCPHCGKMVQSLKSHILLHIGVKNISCEKCPRKFYSKNLLKFHMRLHDDKAEYKCDICMAIFNRADTLKKHQYVHTGTPLKFPCEICGKSFRNKGHLWRHCQGVHNMGVKNFSCEQCSMTFVTKSNLNHHMRVHTGERPFKCEICSQPYSYKTDFTRHCFKKHGVFIKGRKVNVLNEEVLVKERAVMRDLMLRINGIKKDDNKINPFIGPHAAKAFEQAVKALEAKQIHIDF